jgi:hypothetical protein
LISQTGFSFAADLPIADTLTVNGETRYISEWAKHAGISEDTLRKRLAAEWEPEKAVSAPKQVTNRPVALRKQKPPGAPGSSTWYELDWKRDPWAKEFVAAHPDGASLEEVGAAMGVEVSWVCEMEQTALKKLRERMRAVRRGEFKSLEGQLDLVGGRQDQASIDYGAWTLAELVRYLLDDYELDEAEEEAGESLVESQELPKSQELGHDQKPTLAALIELELEDDEDSAEEAAGRLAGASSNWGEYVDDVHVQEMLL